MIFSTLNGTIFSTSKKTYRGTSSLTWTYTIFYWITSISAYYFSYFMVVSPGTYTSLGWSIGTSSFKWIYTYLSIIFSEGTIFSTVWVTLWIFSTVFWWITGFSWIMGTGCSTITGIWTSLSFTWTSLI